jgi:hypothetical protein
MVWWRSLAEPIHITPIRTMPMNTPSDETRRFLDALVSATQGNPAAKVSMFDLGQTLGLDKAQAGRLGEEMISLGWAEIKTLSGAIGITTEGLQAAAPAGSIPGAETLCLGRQRLLTTEGRSAAEKALAMVQESLCRLSTTYAGIEEIVIDVKTAQVQLLSTQPKTAILREILSSLQAALSRAGAKESAAVIEGMLV